MERMPVLFLGHGSPLNITADNGYTRALARAAGQWRRPAAILVVSAHWVRRGVAVNAAPQPWTIHDFYGFPSELYRVRYACPGQPELARRLAGDFCLTDVDVDEKRGLDHGAWAVLHHLYPAADIPVLQLSLDARASLAQHYRLGQCLASLRAEGVLLIGSGNLVHNLREAVLEEVDHPPFAWAQQFDEVLRRALLTGDHTALIAYEELSSLAARANPTMEHYWPLLYVLGATQRGEPVEFLYEGIQNGSVSMRSLRIG